MDGKVARHAEMQQQPGFSTTDLREQVLAVTVAPHEAVALQNLPEPLCGGVGKNARVHDVCPRHGLPESVVVEVGLELGDVGKFRHVRSSGCCLAYLANSGAVSMSSAA